MDAQARRIGNYWILGQLNAGGEGLVYRAVHRSGQPSALKIPRTSKRSEVEALNREIRILKHLNASSVPGVVQLLETGRHGGRPWYAMEWIVGSDMRSFAFDLWSSSATLSHRPEELGLVAPTVDLPIAGLKPDDPPEPSSSSRRLAATASHTNGSGHDFSPQRLRRGLRVLAQLARVLRDIHQLGLIHGDLSPANILLRNSGEPVLIDFGTSISLFEVGLARETPFAWGQMRGTPGYAAPEVLCGESVDWRCDVYSLGCIAYELLVGRRPFLAATVQDLVRQHLLAPLPSPADECPLLPTELQHMLRRMLERDPGRRTQQLDAIVDQLARGLGEPAPSAETRSQRVFFRPVLAGRRAEVQALQATIGDLANDKGGFVLVRGASGIGKTRLLNETASFAARRGVTIVACRGVDRPAGTEGSGLLGGVLELLAPIFQAANELPRREPEPHGLRALLPLPQIKAILQPYAPNQWLEDYEQEALPSLGAEAAVQRVFAALVALLQHLAREASLLVLLDDLHAADALSRLFLQKSSDKLANSRVLVLGAIRSDADEIVSSPLAKAARQVLEIGALDALATTDVAKSLLGAEQLPEGLDDYVLRHSEGNPLFAAEYLRLAVERRWLRWEAQAIEWHPPAPAPAGSARAAIPVSVDELVSSRLEQLPAPARDVARVAAILGREFDEGALEAMCPKQDLVRPLRQLVLAQVLEELPSGAYRFSYEKLRELAASDLDPHLRRRLHRSVAESLEPQLARRALQRSSELGYHWAEAGEPARALGHLTTAAAEAAREGALDTACELYQAAIYQCGLLGASGPYTPVAKLLEQLGDLLLTRARHAQARDCFERAGRDHPSRLVRARLHRKRAASLWTLHDYVAANEALERAERELSLLDEQTDEHQREAIEVKLGRFEHLYFSQKKGAQIESLLAELGPLVERFGCSSQRNTFYLAAASHRQLAARYAFDARAVELAQRAFEAARDLTQDRQATARFLYAFALVFGSSAQREQALPHLVQAAREATHIQSTTLLSRIRAYHAIATLRLGRVNETLSVAEQALRAAEEARLPPYMAAASACLGWVQWRSCNLSEARKLLARARHTWLAHPHPFPFRWVAGFPLLALAQAEDDFASARELLTDLLDPGQQLLPDPLVVNIQDAITACAEGEGRSANEAIARVLRSARDEHFS